MKTLIVSKTHFNATFSYTIAMFFFILSYEPDNQSDTSNTSRIHKTLRIPLMSRRRHSFIFCVAALVFLNKLDNAYTDCY